VPPVPPLRMGWGLMRTGRRSRECTAGASGLSDVLPIAHTAAPPPASTRNARRRSPERARLLGERPTSGQRAQRTLAVIVDAVGSSRDLPRAATIPSRHLGSRQALCGADAAQRSPCSCSTHRGRSAEAAPARGAMRGGSTARVRYVRYLSTPAVELRAVGRSRRRSSLEPCAEPPFDLITRTTRSRPRRALRAGAGTPSSSRFTAATSSGRVARVREGARTVAKALAERRDRLANSAGASSSSHDARRARTRARAPRTDLPASVSAAAAADRHRRALVARKRHSE